MEKIKILVVHNNTLFYSSIYKAFENNENFEFYECKLKKREFIDYTYNVDPDIVAIIVERIDTHVVKNVLGIKVYNKNAKIIFIVNDYSSEEIDIISKCGCLGVIDHNSEIMKLEELFYRIYTGETIFCLNGEHKQITVLENKNVIKDRLKIEICDNNEITYRERQILSLIADGYTSKEIATVLKLSVRTVEGYRSSMIQKFNLRSSTHLIAYALSTVLLPNEK